jgi:hypothetical protein
MLLEPLGGFLFAKNGEADASVQIEKFCTSRYNSQQATLQE